MRRLVGGGAGEFVPVAADLLAGERSDAINSIFAYNFSLLLNCLRSGPAQAARNLTFSRSKTACVAQPVYLPN